MTSFFSRLKDYYVRVGQVLRGEAEAASIFPNTTDIGMSREKIYGEVLNLHLPSSCNVLYGGFLFDLDGNESKQVDIIVTNHSSMQFNFLNREHGGKSFACIEGCLAVVSVKSTLDKAQLIDALENLSSIPDKIPLGERVSPLLRINSYDDWPYKVIFASNGIAVETLLVHLTDYYLQNPEVPFNKRPNIIHVLNKYVVIRVGPNGAETRDGTKLEPNTFYPMVETTDVYGLFQVLSAIQNNAVAAQHINYNYIDIINKFDF